MAQNTLQYLNNQLEKESDNSVEKKSGYPIKEVVLDGSAANAHTSANVLDKITSTHGQLFQSTQSSDWVSRIIGGNPVTTPMPVKPFNLIDAHSSYSGFEPLEGVRIGETADTLREITDRNWGAGKHSEPVLVLPDRLRKKNTSD